MRRQFVVGDYTYTRPDMTEGSRASYTSWAKNATKTSSWSVPTGYDYVTDATSLYGIKLILFNPERTFYDEYKFIYGESEVDDSSENFTVTYGGASSITVKAKKALSRVILDRSVTFYDKSQVNAKATSLSQISYANIPSTVTDDDGVTATVTDCDFTFSGCRNLVTAPTIPNTVESIQYCFNNCASLVSAPEIPSSVIFMERCFSKCVALEGNVVVNNPLSGYYSSMNMFINTVNDIFIVNNGSGETSWKRIASEYANVHYEADDNPVPAVSGLNATRVASNGATTFEPTGLYAYIQATVTIYDVIPVGWTNELKGTILKDNGTTETVTWQPPITGYPADIYCWIYLGDTSTHTISLQISDSVKDNGVEVVSQTSAVLSKVLSKSYALVDYYHDEITDTEGMSIGKYAEQADLFDVDMPTLFRQSITAKDWAGFIQIFAGSTPPTGWKLCDGSEVAIADYPTLHRVIGTTYNDGTEASGYFRLPNLMSRFPIGIDNTSYLLGDTGGSADAIVPYHRHSVPAVSNAITGGSHNHEIKYVNTTRGSGSTSTRMGPYSYTNTKYDGVYNKPNDHTHNLPAHNTNYAGTSGQEVGANIPPYLGINFIICTGETS